MVDLNYMYKKYYNYIRRIVINIINEDPDDIAQMAFVKLDKLADYTEEHGKAFLIKVAKNMCMDYIRKRKRERMNEEKMKLDLGMFAEPATEQEQNELELAQIHADVIEFIYQEIKKLPPATRKVFELHLAGREQNDICTELNLSTQTVRNHLTTARQHLRIEILFNKKDVLQLLTKRPEI